jgi:hypothetical protein
MNSHREGKIHRHLKGYSKTWGLDDEGGQVKRKRIQHRSQQTRWLCQGAQNDFFFLKTGKHHCLTAESDMRDVKAGDPPVKVLG